MVRLRVRIRFCKQGDLRFIGHRDLMRCLERLFRRAGLTLSFSEGFHPKPRMTFPLALAVGIEGVDEVMEVELAERYEAEELRRRLAPQARRARVPRDRSPARRRQKAQVQSVVVRGPDPRRAGPAWANGSGVCWPPRRGRSSVGTAPAIDLRPLLLELALDEGVLRMRLPWKAKAASARATCWPRSDWATSSSRASASAAPPWRSAT